MKQYVNLYRGDLIPVRQKLTLNKLILGGLAVAASVLLVTLITYWHYSQVRSQNTLLTEQASTVDNQLGTLQARLSNRKPSVELEKKKEQLQTYLQDGRTFLSSVSDFRAPETPAVADLLNALAEITPEGIWLESFGLSGNNIYLQGYAADTQQLVLWMDTFEQSEMLASQRFSVVALSRNEKGEQFFQLRTERLKGQSQQ